MNEKRIANERINAFLQKLSELSSQHKAEWQTIPRYFSTTKNEPLRKYIIEENNYSYSKKIKGHMWIQEYSSYVMRFEEGAVILLHGELDGSTVSTIAVQTDTTCPLVFFEGHDEKLINALYDVVSDNNYPTNRFMQKIIDM